MDMYNPMTIDILRLCRQVIAHSYMYYLFDESIISDDQFDHICIALDKRRAELKGTRFEDIFENWDKSSGYDLIRHDLGGYHTYYSCIARDLIRYSVREQE